MFSLLGWDDYHIAHPALITMFGATPGMAEAELIDFVAENGSVPTRTRKSSQMAASSFALPKPLRGSKGISFFPSARVGHQGLGRPIRIVDHLEYSAIFSAIKENEEELQGEKPLR